MNFGLNNITQSRVVPRKLKLVGGGGGILTIDYWSQTVGCCFPYCFLETFVVGQGLDGEGQSHDGGLPSPPFTRENPAVSICLALIYSYINSLNIYKNCYKKTTNTLTRDMLYIAELCLLPTKSQKKIKGFVV